MSTPASRHRDMRPDALEGAGISCRRRRGRRHRDRRSDRRRDIAAATSVRSCRRPRSAIFADSSVGLAAPSLRERSWVVRPGKAHVDDAGLLSEARIGCLCNRHSACFLALAPEAPNARIARIFAAGAAPINRACAAIAPAMAASTMICSREVSRGGTGFGSKPRQCQLKPFDLQA